MELDIRCDGTEEVTSIRFADDTRPDGTRIAHQLEQRFQRDSTKLIKIIDGSEFVLIKDAEHARHLIAALEKAITLGWLE